jgi:hypothetical protein
MTTQEAQKALIKAIWSCIVDASSMNVVLSGPEVNAAIRDLKAAVAAEAVAARNAEIAEDVRGLKEGKVRDHVTGRLYGTDQVSRTAVLALLVPEETA